MFFRACSFYIQLTKALKNGSLTHKRDAWLIGNVTKICKQQRVPRIDKTGNVKNSLLPHKLCGITISLIGLKAIANNRAYCELKTSSVIAVEKHEEPILEKLAVLIYVDIWRWIGAILAALFVAYINITLPLCLGDLANIIANIATDASRSMREELHLPVGKLVLLYIAQAFGTLAYISLLSSAGENLAVKLKCDLYNSYLQQDMTFYDQKRTGELLDCLYTDVQEFKSSFKQCVSQGLKNIIQICGCMISLFTISTGMTVAVISIVPVVIIAGSSFGVLLRKISYIAQVESIKSFNMSEEVLSNIRTVRSFSNEGLEQQKFKHQLQKASNMNIILGYGIGIFQAGTNLFLNGLVLGTLYLGSHYVVSDNLSPGHLMSFLVTAQIIQKSFAQLSLTFGHFIKGKQSFERICHFSSLKPSIPIYGGIRVPYHSFVPAIEFRNVTFAYPTRPDQVILDNLNFTIPAGKTIAIVGASGNGKSTIALLLERFYDIGNGSITISNVDIRMLDPHWLRGTVIGIINQEPVLFATTIKENIRYGKPDATDDEIYVAAQQANADSFIMEFPDGYDTLVGERGAQISGGQKQRIAIARALIKKPSILILDEATSALDPEAEKVVQETLEKICIGKTVLIIAHRLSTVRNADLIAVLNKGVILEMGTHDSLMKNKGAYYRMMDQQKTETPRAFVTGHDYLQAHLFGIGVKESPVCPLCGKEDMRKEGTYRRYKCRVMNVQIASRSHSF